MRTAGITCKLWTIQVGSRGIIIDQIIQAFRDFCHSSPSQIRIMIYSTLWLNLAIYESCIIMPFGACEITACNFSTFYDFIQWHSKNPVC